MGSLNFWQMLKCIRLRGLPEFLSLVPTALPTFFRRCSKIDVKWMSTSSLAWCKRNLHLREGWKILPCKLQAYFFDFHSPKLSEHIIQRHIMNHFDKLDIHSDIQHGFRKGRSRPWTVCFRYPPPIALVQWVQIFTLPGHNVRGFSLSQIVTFSHQM